ncbi:hypothetical protein GCM10027449_29680 [Sinomonas notoginsengisoli]
MVNPVHLTSLIEVVRLGSFAAAAANLGYTPSAVSQQMAALERETGVKLFHRTARSIEATEAALVMTRHAAKVLTDIDALKAATTRAAETAGRELRLGIFPSLATYVLPQVLRGERWGRLGLDLHASVAEPGETVRRLAAGGDLDVVLVYQVGQSGLAWPHTAERLWVGDDPFHVVLPESWGIADGARVTADQLGGMPWIVHHPGTSDTGGDRPAVRRVRPRPPGRCVQRRLQREPRPRLGGPGCGPGPGARASVEARGRGGRRRS